MPLSCMGKVEVFDNHDWNTSFFHLHPATAMSIFPQMHALFILSLSKWYSLHGWVANSSTSHQTQLMVWSHLFIQCIELNFFMKNNNDIGINSNKTSTRKNKGVSIIKEMKWIKLRFHSPLYHDFVTMCENECIVMSLPHWVLPIQVADTKHSGTTKNMKRNPRVVLNKAVSSN